MSLSKLSVGLVGWRGMVGSVLMQRMSAERDFDAIETTFFSTSSAGKPAPKIEGCKVFDPILKDGNDITALKAMDVIITCQGGDYTKAVYAPLRAAGWNGHWIDASKILRMDDDAIIILDPVNMPVIQTALAKGVKNWIGGNCTVSCMLMGVGALYKAGPRGMDANVDVPSGLGWRCAEHARTVDAIRLAVRRSQRFA
jgi:aspartate-semialdehyde dehydrogenase